MGEEVDITDFSIFAGDDEIRASKVILYAESEFFRDLDDDYDMGDSHVSTFSANTMSQIIHMISTVYFREDQDFQSICDMPNLVEILRALDFYRIPRYLAELLDYVECMPKNNQELVQFLINIRSHHVAAHLQTASNYLWKKAIDILINHSGVHSSISLMRRSARARGAECGSYLCNALIKFIKMEVSKETYNDFLVLRMIEVLASDATAPKSELYIKDDMLRCILYSVSHDKAANKVAIQYIKQHWKEEEEVSDHD